MPLILAACTMINPDYDEVEPEAGGAGTTTSGGPEGAGWGDRR